MSLVAILVAAVAAYAIGILWYSPYLFGKPWRRLTGAPETGRPGPVRMIAALVALIVAAYVLSTFLASLGAYAAWEGAEGAFWAWLGLVAAFGSFQLTYERRSPALFAIDQAYYLVSLMVMGAMLASW